MKLGILAAMGLAVAHTGCKDAGEGVPPPPDVAEAGGEIPTGGKSAPREEAPGVPAASPKGTEGDSPEAIDPGPPPSRLPAVRVPAATPGRGETPQPLFGRPGYARNPYTGGAIDMRGHPAGALVRDPADPDPSHTFRVSREIVEAYNQTANQRGILSAKQRAKELRHEKAGRAPLPRDD